MRVKESNAKVDFFSHYVLLQASPDYLIQSKQGMEPEGNGNSCCCSLSFDEYTSESWNNLVKCIFFNDSV